MRPRPATRATNSLRTFFIYFFLVLSLVVISLAVKVFFLFQQSVFDGNHQFILAVSNKQKVDELVIFSPQDRLITEISLEGSSIKKESLGSILSVLPDAYVVSSLPLAESSATDTMRQVLWHFPSVTTNMTIIDAFRLMMAAQRAAINKQEQETITVSEDVESIDKEIKNLFVNDTIFAENISIQVVNASDKPGLGRRLERALKHLGCNVVAVSSARNQEKASMIHYYGEKSYTLEKLAKLLHFSIQQTQKRTIADIVIIIGNDNKDLNIF